MKTLPHYDPGFYVGNKPYRDCLVAALEYFGFTDFGAGEEFWTLGGMEWAEYRYLADNRITFGENAYRNVDRGEIAVLDDSCVVAHPGIEFLDIHDLWVCPRAICFDCTEGLVRRNECGWVDLVNLGIAGAKLSGSVCLNWNYMTGYGNLKFMGVDELLELYKRWLSILWSHVDCADMDVEFFGEGVLEPKEGSLTPMLSGHCLISAR